MTNTILVLDDQKYIRDDLADCLTPKDYIVHTADNIELATEIIRSTKIDFALIDLKIDFRSDYGGITIIKELNRRQPKTKIIIVSAYELNDELKKQLSEVEYFGFVNKGDKRNNFIDLVVAELQNVQKQSASKKCFVIMPFSDTKKCTSKEWEDIFYNTIRPAVEKSGYGYTCHKANLHIGNIITDILDNLNKADVVIADLTDRNPNVYYELGVRHTLTGSTILITQSIEDVPFDLRPYALIEYGWKTKDEKKDFFKKIKETFHYIENSEKNITSPVRDYLELTF